MINSAIHQQNKQKAFALGTGSFVSVVALAVPVLQLSSGVPQVIHHHPSILIHVFRTGVESLKVYARGEKSCKDEGSPLYGGLGAHSPRKLLNLETYKCHWGSFLQDIFSKLIHKKMQ